MTHDKQAGAAKAFATTRWSIVLRAAHPTSKATQQALGELMEAHWNPLYGISRRQGQIHHDAMDLTQGLFAHLLRGAALASNLLLSSSGWVGILALRSQHVPAGLTNCPCGVPGLSAR